jgi:transposase
MLVGSINSVSSLKLTVSESGARNVVVIGDKGFYSSKNASDLEGEGLHYVLPLKRTSSLIRYGRMKKGTSRAFDGHFLFEDDRVVWHYRYDLGKSRHIVVFLDSKLKAEEEKDSVARCDDRDMAKFFEKQHVQGTIAVITDLDADAKRVYELLKCRVNIEQLFDTFKNTLNADRTYMRDDYHLQGWILINFVAMLLYYKIYNLLLNNDLLGRFSPKDVLTHLVRVHKLKIGDEWVTSEVPKKTRLIVEKLQIPIMQN